MRAYLVARFPLQETARGTGWQFMSWFQLQSFKSVRSSVIFPGFFKSTSKSNIEQPAFLIRPPLLPHWWLVAHCAMNGCDILAFIGAVYYKYPRPRPLQARNWPLAAGRWFVRAISFEFRACAEQDKVISKFQDSSRNYRNFR